MIYFSHLISTFLLFLVLSESVLQSPFTCFHVEPTGELSCILEQGHCEPKCAAFQYIRDFYFSDQKSLVSYTSLLHAHFHHP